MFNAMLRHRIVIFEQFVVSIIVCVYTVIVMFEVNIVCTYLQSFVISPMSMYNSHYQNYVVDLPFVNLRV